ncbi:hypothetical protein F4810DRAFT_720023 [Camillea tinctor]|nr:hypothetical protein F4810DRAFT_720023 [Camillea tinctor]
MSDYLENFDFDAYVAAHSPDPFDFACLDQLPSIESDGVDANTNRLPSDQEGLGSPDPQASPRSNICSKCREKSRFAHQVCEPARSKIQATFVCDFPDCNASFISDSSLKSHMTFRHESGHQEVKWTHENACIECDEPFHFKSWLEEHAQDGDHKPFAFFQNVPGASGDFIVTIISFNIFEGITV